jgi:hypothetical protein
MSENIGSLNFQRMPENLPETLGDALVPSSTAAPQFPIRLFIDRANKSLLGGAKVVP